MAGMTRAGLFRVRLVAVLTIAYVVFVLCVTLYPSSVDRPFDPDLIRFLTALHRRGVPAFVDYTFVESAANVVFFVPLGFLAALLVPVTRWWGGILTGLVLSSLIELTQHLFLPGRVGTIADVAANTAGAAIGTGLEMAVRAVVRHRDGLVRADVAAGVR